MLFLSFLLVIAFSSLVLTRALRCYALRHALMDIPNERSSHNLPTPRGGGAAIVLMFSVGVTALALAGELQMTSFWALVGGGSWVALIGWLDDQRDIPALLRLPGHFIGAGWALFWLGGLPPLHAFGLYLDFGLFGCALASVYMVWLLNLYNFMDGIDGIAGIEAITVCVGAIILFALSPQAVTLWALPALLAAAVAGFLPLNFPKARIFMGDTGSGFLGFVLGILSIQAAWVKPELFWGWLILLGSFIVDSTLTLLIRIWRREKIHQAHRSHAYQHAARRLRSHTIVALTIGGINLFWLLPVATLVVTDRLDGALGVIIAYIPLVWAALMLKAGKME